MLKVMLIVLVGLAVLYGCIVGYFYSVQDRMIFPRVVNSVAAPDPDINPNMEVLSLTTPDGAELKGLLLPAFDVPPGPFGKPTLVLAFAGNAHDVTGFVGFLKNEVFAEDNVAVAGYSYRGYPNALEMPSTGTPTEDNLLADALGQYDAMVARVHPGRVMVIGYSLGTAVAAYVAQQRKVDSVILVAPFTSMADVVRSHYGFLPVDALLKHKFDTATRLKDLAARQDPPRLTVMYSPEDGLIPADEPQALAAAYPSTTVVILAGKRHEEVLFHDKFAGAVKAAFK